MLGLARYACMYMNLSMQVSLACLVFRTLFVRDVKVSLVGGSISSDVARGRRRSCKSAVLGV